MLRLYRHYLNRAQLRRLFGHQVTHNTAALLALQLVSYGLSLATIPYLARVLAPSGWGLVIFAQAYVVWLTPIIEYGFIYSATRTLARQRDHAEALATLAATVMGAKLLLAGVVIAITLCAWRVVPVFAHHPAYLGWACCSILLVGLAPVWYVSGTERLVTLALIEIGNRLLVLLGTFLFITAPDAGWGVLAVQAAGNLFKAAMLLGLLYAKVRWRAPALGAVLAALRQGWSLFILYSTRSLSTTANSFILGLLAAPVYVGYFGGAEKLWAALAGLLGPVSSALYPHISHLLPQDRPYAARIARQSCVLLTLLGTVLAIGVSLASPLLVRVVLGPAYHASVPILQVLACSIPLLAIHAILGMAWMIPLGLDRHYAAITALGSVLTVGIAGIGIGRLGPIALAYGIVMAQMLTVVCLLVVLQRRRLNPFGPAPLATAADVR